MARVIMRAAGWPSREAATGRAALELRPEGQPEPHGDLGRHVDVDDAATPSREKSVETPRDSQTGSGGSARRPRSS